MEIRIVKGRFVTVEKLEALISANGLSLSALVDGASRKIEELNETGKKLAVDAQDYLAKSLACQDAADKVLDQRNKIQEAVNSIKDE